MRQVAVLPPSAYTPADLAFIVPRVLELTYTSHSIAPFARDLGHSGAPFPWDEDRRALLRAQLDAWYARAYGLTRDELRYILDPADVIGPTYPSETFRVLKTNETKRHGDYRTARLVLQAWDAMVRGETSETAPPIRVTAQKRVAVLLPVDPSILADEAWARRSDSPDATLAQLAAIIKALPGPTPISHIRLAALYALEPRYLTRRLSGTDRATWLRLVGQAAQPVKGANIAAFAPRIDGGWRRAIVQLHGMRAIVEDAGTQTWAPGGGIDQFEIDAETWPYGRATFVLKALEAMTPDTAITELPDEDRTWVKDYAA